MIAPFLLSTPVSCDSDVSRELLNEVQPSLMIISHLSFSCCESKCSVVNNFYCRAELLNLVIIVQSLFISKNANNVLFVLAYKIICCYSIHKRHKVQNVFFF